ncbi:hypothetical protein OU798_05850 [Prolixibacteraceae bacterium Z1-6]|uniref:Uncharacterized protein n=1 Tax=Draconibacterium aestuarii TaxID=2998507 RepID=A0A9X3F3G1_9BACT|nr:hypothetical protein [Prolixibacteraceae bacterium Z1-6]
MQRRRKNKLDTIGTGLLAGLVTPVFIFFIFYLVKESDVSFVDYIRSMWRIQALVKVVSLCVFTNVAVFWIFLKKKYEKAARGVLGATILYAFLVLISRAI